MLTSKSVYGFPATRFGAELPFDQPDRGILEEETKTGRPTQALKRTADAVSTGGGQGMGVAVSQLEW